MTAQSPHFTDLIQRYFAMWNEPDTARRRDLIAATWTADATYRDPAMAGAGHAEIDALVQATQDRFPGYSFRQTRAVDAYDDNLRFGWELAPAEGPALVAGTDFGVVAADGRLRTVTGFFDHVAAPDAAS